MKSIFVLAILASGALAQFDQSSKPFRLFLKSDNATLDGQTLGACHQGAAIEGLCPSGNTHANNSTSYDTFYQQTQAEPTVPGADGDPYGPIVWNLTVNGGDIVPSYLQFSYDFLSDVSNPTFFPGNESYTSVSFTSAGCMYLARYLDDTVTPPQRLDTPQKVENWYICLTRWSYLYYTLNWKIGVEGVPQNPTCQKVTVYREFV
ncbi:uncharacterized protein N0V89_009997 [Didymosphaeria variabile]|uniref:DUF7907 domain-containing protein n=1 Tax=Didymosphaeria variabile TaxID=1932322 RepID=A0A9W8XFD4_9PLEO|nr:uncharacterized protein N0V89_009997 [Didymosphaeria variabile]KAJ4348619.1 hypothetical protein N0V89_009997 [Didymosphaeria variabile]